LLGRCQAACPYADLLIRTEQVNFNNTQNKYAKTDYYNAKGKSKDKLHRIRLSGSTCRRGAIPSGKPVF